MSKPTYPFMIWKKIKENEIPDPNSVLEYKKN